MTSKDHVDDIVDLWKAREPDLDTGSLHVVGRLLRAAADINRVRERALAQFRITVGDFDVLATLRRTSGPAGLNAKYLSRSALVTSGAMTTRLDRLERAGLVERRPDPDDRRGVLVRLTGQGHQVAGDAVQAVLHAHDEYLAALPDGDRVQLVSALRKLVGTT